MTYLVIMRRWGNDEDHHYPILITNSLIDALRAGIEHSEMRSDKYEPSIFCGESPIRLMFRTTEECIEVLEELEKSNEPNKNK